MTTQWKSRMALYPRAWEPEEEPKKILLGLYDLLPLLHVHESTVRGWLAKVVLPFADGPDVNNFPTWKRGTILAWAYMRGMIPADLVGEAQEFLGGPDGKEALEQMRDMLFPTK